jgi:hypothetical protein
MTSTIQGLRASPERRSRTPISKAYEPMTPAKMPHDYAANFRKALPETHGSEQIEVRIAEASVKTMIEAPF